MNQPKPIHTALTDLFDMDYPILGAPMFLVSNEKMVKAASLAGGLGTFPALNYRPIENYEKVIKNLKGELQSKPFGINIIVQKSNRWQEQHIDLAIEHEVPLIITSLGNPKDIIKKTRGTKTKVFCDVVGLEHARKVYDLGADGLIVVGSGAGGHGGEVSLFALIPWLKKSVPLPIVAAGCMNGGESLLAALGLGADGIYMGTRLIATPEAEVSADYKQAIIQSTADDIINTDRVDGFPGNFILTEDLKKQIKPNLAEDIFSRIPKVKRTLSLMRAGRALFGNPNQKLSYKNTFSAGHGVAGIDKVESIQDIFWRTAQDYHERLSKLPQ